jgi:hypothetical protein
MTNKLVAIINSLKYQKLRNFYYMKWNFLYQITAACRTPYEGATAPRSPFRPLSSTEFFEPPPRKKIPGYATATNSADTEGRCFCNGCCGTISQQAAVHPWLAADAHGNKQTNKQTTMVAVFAHQTDQICDVTFFHYHFSVFPPKILPKHCHLRYAYKL